MEEKKHLPPQSVLYMVAKRKGFTRKEMKAGILDKYGVKSATELLVRQYNEIMAVLDALPDVKKVLDKDK